MMDLDVSKYRSFADMLDKIRRRNPGPEISVSSPTIATAKRAAVISRELDKAFRRRTHYPTLASVHDMLDGVASKAGLRLKSYIPQAMPYGDTHETLLETSDPDLFIRIHLHRTPKGEYEVTGYPTRQTHRGRRKTNPAGDIEDLASRTVAQLLVECLSPGHVQYIGLGPDKLVVASDGDTIVLWSEHWSMEAMRWVRTSENLEIDADDESLLSAAVHYAYHNHTLAGFDPEMWLEEYDDGVFYKTPEHEGIEDDVPYDEIPEHRNPLTEEDLAEADLQDTHEDAEALYEEFHGRPSEEDVEVNEVSVVRDHLTSLGSLQEVTVDCITGSKIKISFDGETMLCSSVDGKQLYIIGGDQELDLESIGLEGAASSKDQVLVGAIDKIVYRTQKSFDQFQIIDYVHELGEDSGMRPALVYDTLNKSMSIVGGNYDVRQEGIVD